MATTEFTDGVTLTAAAWFNDADALIYDVMDSPTTVQEARATLSVNSFPQVSQSADYTTVLTDAGKHILHPASDANSRTFTIDSNANVPYPVGTQIMFINESANTITIAITSDTLTRVGTGATGSRTLSVDSIAVAIKITSTSWYIYSLGGTLS